MTLASLLVHDVTVVRAGDDTDRYGNTARDWSTATSTATKAWVHQQTGSEVLDGRDAQVSGWVCYLPAGTVVDGADRIVWGALTFEVDGPPTRAWTPQGEHHVEARLRHVDG